MSLEKILGRSTHTPGPWEHVKAEYLSHDAPGYEQMLTPGGILAAGDAEEGPTWVIEGEIDFLPDARLIAAAPDMLAALKEMVDEADNVSHAHGWPLASRLNNARAAISKATGATS